MWMVCIPFISCLKSNSIAWSPRTFLAPCRQTCIFLANMSTWTWPFVGETKGQPLFSILSQKLHQLLKYSTYCIFETRSDILIRACRHDRTKPRTVHYEAGPSSSRFRSPQQIGAKGQNFSRYHYARGTHTTQWPVSWICHTRVAYQLIRRTSSIIYVCCTSTYHLCTNGVLIKIFEVQGNASTLTTVWLACRFWSRIGVVLLSTSSTGTSFWWFWDDASHQPRFLFWFQLMLALQARRAFCLLL